MEVNRETLKGLVNLEMDLRSRSLDHYSKGQWNLAAAEAGKVFNLKRHIVRRSEDERLDKRITYKTELY